VSPDVDKYIHLVVAAVEDKEILIVAAVVEETVLNEDRHYVTTMIIKKEMTKASTEARKEDEETNNAVIKTVRHKAEGHLQGMEDHQGEAFLPVQDLMVSNTEEDIQGRHQQDEDI
jgi:hypothetical protein